MGAFRGLAGCGQVLGGGVCVADRVRQRDHAVDGGTHGLVLDEDAQGDQRA
ncbi:hypothetical protein [Streptomyces sp. NPDC029674]|uniref:hypothetical protein n=1 Tax=Streptomyces sp. NPDC029674 TaxID=3365297 RepID=UPI00384D5B4E